MSSGEEKTNAGTKNNRNNLKEEVRAGAFKQRAESGEGRVSGGRMLQAENRASAKVPRQRRE